MKPSLLVALSLLVLVRSAPPSLQELHEAGLAHHLERSLDAASAMYDEVLRGDPPREPSAEEWRAIERFAPRLFVTGSEAFQLKDVAAIVHPDTGVIAYHLSGTTTSIFRTITIRAITKSSGPWCRRTGRR